jgi:coenzyme PQQ synthesis protein D (PqqD)
MNLTLADHVSVTETEDGVVLLDQRAGRYWQLNQTAALVLRCLLDGGTPEAARSVLQNCCSVSPEQADRDVTALIGSLHASVVITG